MSRVLCIKVQYFLCLLSFNKLCLVALIHLLLLCCVVLFHRYDNQLRTEYRIQCQEGELAFFNVTELELQGEQDCQDDEGNFRSLTII